MIGDADWLIEAEKRYGGFVTGIPRNVYSPAEDRTFTTLTGGDRMSPEHHNYAPVYAEFLAPFVARRMDRMVVVELGILNGSGLAMWSELFQNAHIIGLDLELAHVKRAFPHNSFELHEFDELVATPEIFANILCSRKIDIMVDDAFHTDEAILRMFQIAYPFMSDDSVYFMEDNLTVADRVVAPDAKIKSVNEITVVRRKV
jgi:hypothetical protein